MANGEKKLVSSKKNYSVDDLMVFWMLMAYIVRWS